MFTYFLHNVHTVFFHIDNVNYAEYANYIKIYKRKYFLNIRQLPCLLAINYKLMFKKDNKLYKIFILIM